jgi:hypothetical protein
MIYEACPKNPCDRDSGLCCHARPEFVGAWPGWLVETFVFLIIRSSVHAVIPEIEKTAWPESASELYRPSDLRLSAKLVPTFADRWCHVVSATDPYGRILRFIDRIRYPFFQGAPQMYFRG